MKPIIPFSILVALSFVLLAVVVARGLQPPEPPIHYTQAEYAPEDGVLLAGETLVYTPTLTVNRSGRVDIIRSFWDVGRNQAGLLCDGSAAPSITTVRALPASLHGELRQQPVRVVLPALRPGLYLLVSAATKPDGGEAATQVRFRLVGACGGR